MKEDELKEIFVAEALEGYEELNKQFIILENDHNHKKAIDTIFRITHTLKANAAGMGFDDVASIAHTLEDVFTEVKNGKIVIDANLFNDLFRANDILGSMLNAIKNNFKEPVKFKGIKTKLEVLIRRARFGENSLPEDKSSAKSNNYETKNIVFEEKSNNSQDESETSTSATEPGDSISISNLNEHRDISPANDKEVQEEQEKEQETKLVFSDLVSIPVRKLDNLMNLVGELIIERDRVVTTFSSKTSRSNEFSRLQRISSELQYSIMDVRLVQVSVLFNKFHRIVRDTASTENKNVKLVLEGTENEIDRNILQIISDSLVHLVRNGISHGIETPEERKKNGKPEYGTLILSAKSEKDAVIIDIIDDGKGIDANIIKKKAIEKGLMPSEIIEKMTEQEIIQFIFEPGFSSADKVTSVSGRGVGMDVVKQAIDSIGGKIEIETEVGKGTKFSLILPSSMALKAALLFGMGDSEYAIPLSYTDTVIQITPPQIHKVGKGLITVHKQKTISLVFLRDLLAMKNIEELSSSNVLQKAYNDVQSANAADKYYVIVVSYGKREVGFVVDRLLQQKEIVEKPLYKPLENLKFISGATILGNGKVCLVLDIPSILSSIFKINRII
jgi:two-component system chemotaxis sensor kinase CheA